MKQNSVHKGDLAERPLAGALAANKQMTPLNLNLCSIFELLDDIRNIVR
jgi:hypothetical protein